MSFQSENDDTMAAVADETREMVLAAALQLAKRLVDHVDEYGLHFACLTEELETGDYRWTMHVGYGVGHTFVRAQADMTAVRADSISDSLAGLPKGLVQALAGSPPAGASFDSNIPRTWLELAHSASEKIR